MPTRLAPICALLALWAGGLAPTAGAAEDYLDLRLRLGVLPGLDDATSTQPGTVVSFGTVSGTTTLFGGGSVSGTVMGMEVPVGVESGADGSLSPNLQPVFAYGHHLGEQVGVVVGGGPFYRVHRGDYGTTAQILPVFSSTSLTAGGVMASFTTTGTGGDLTMVLTGGSDYAAYGLHLFGGVTVAPVEGLTLEFAPFLDWGLGEGDTEPLLALPSPNSLASGVITSTTGTGSVSGDDYLAYGLQATGLWTFGNGIQIGGDLGWMQGTAEDEVLWDVTAFSFGSSAAFPTLITTGSSTFVERREFDIQGFFLHAVVGFRF